MQENFNLKKYSVKDVILILSDVDNKINALQECSSEDFLSLNEHLRIYFKKAGIISHNSSEILDIIRGEDYYKITQKLNFLQDEIKLQIFLFEERIEKNINTYEKILTNLNLLFVPLKNYSQNILMLNLILTNLKLNIAFSKSGDVIDEETEIIKKQISDLKPVLQDYEINLNKIKNLTSLTLSKLQDLKKRNFTNVDKIVSNISASIGIIKDKHEEAALKIPELKRITNSYIESFNKIVTNLQYHDIIRQKMEHVQKTHKRIIEELNLINNEGDIDFFKEAEAFIKVKDIATLQVEQLIQTNQQYQKAVDEITRKFLEIADDMSILISLCLQFTGNRFGGSETYFKEVSNKLINVNELLNNFLNINTEFTENTEVITQLIEEKHKTLNDIVIDFYKIKEKEQVILKKVNLAFFDDIEILDIIQQLNNITINAQSNIENVKISYEQIINLSNLSNRTTEYQSNKKSSISNFSKSVTKIDDIIQMLINNNNIVDDKISSNSELGLNISSEIKTTTSQIKYYDLFEKIIIEIVEILSKLHNNIDETTLEIIRKSKKDNLSHLEKDYTMKDQRDVHKKVINDNSSNSQQAEDEDVMFF
jgi:hypothetical protein